MAAANLLYEAQVDRVSADTQSIGTCSAPTLSLLRALLGLDDTAKGAWNGATAPRSIGAKNATATRAVKSSNKSKCGSNANFNVPHSPKLSIKCLPVNRRITLATITFNKTLKNLGDALKAKQTSSYMWSGNTRSPLKETQGRTTNVSNTTSKPGAPSHRPQSKSPELKRKTPQPTPPSFEQATLLATAECAKASLQCLRLSKAGDSATDKQDEQLEQGALVLISKLQGLGLVASAIEETLNVRTALEHILRRQEEHPMHGTETGRKSYGNLTQCIEFEYCGNNPMIFALVTAFQANVLQLIILDDKPWANENLLEQLDISNAKSPCRVLLHGAEQGWLSAERAALQLHALSQNVLSISSVTSNGAPGKPTSHSSGEVQFQMQCLALQICCHWWQIANHRLDIDKEVWIPFDRYVRSLCRRAEKTTRAHFVLVKKCLEQLLDVLSETQNSLSNEKPTLQPSSAVMLTLRNMAEATGSTRESAILLQDLAGSCTVGSGLSGVVSCCKLAAALLLEIGSNTKDLIHMLETTLTLLEKPLKGTATEMEDILIQASRLRKVAVKRFTEMSENLQTSASHDGIYGCLSNVCIRIVFGVLSFVVRYIGFKRQGEPKRGYTAKSAEKDQYSALIAQQSSKSALAAVQSNIIHQYVSWELCTAALDDCLVVRKILNEDCEVVPNTDVKVSNMFWSWYLKQKESGASSRNLVSTLMRSIQALERSTPAEARASFVAVKCERAAALYTELKQIDSARQVLAIAINAHLQDVTFSDAFERGLTQFPQQIGVEADSSEFILGRVLSAYARLLVRHAPEPSFSCFYDKAELKREERALLLEKQFGALTDMLVPESLHPRLKEVAEVVFSLYSQGTYSLNQLRFISTVLSFCSKNGLSPCQFLPEQAVKLCLERPTEDVFSCQTSSERCLHSFILLQYAFQSGSADVELLRRFVSFHTMSIESCDGWTSVLRSIIDPALIIAQAQSVVDFADMLGLMQIKLDALLLMRRLLELQPQRDVPALTSCTTHVGLQYTRMGLTNHAGRAFANAERSLVQSSSKTLIGLQWHLAYAEYLIALSSYEKAAEHLVSAQWRYEADFISDPENGFHGPRIAQHKYLAQAASVASHVALHDGDVDSAIMHAKKSVRLSIRLWSMLEKLLGVKRPSMVGERNDPKLDELTEHVLNMTLSTETQPKASSTKAAAFWAYVQIHFDGLLHLSSLSGHHDSFQDAVYYCEQARKVAEAIESNVLLRRSSSTLAALLARAGRLQGSQLMLDFYANYTEDTDPHMDSVQMSMAIATAHLAMGEFNQGSEAIESAQRALSKIQTDDQQFSHSKTQKESSSRVMTTQRASRSAGQLARNASTQHQQPNKIAGRTAHIDVKDVSASELVAPTSGSTWIQTLQAEALLLRARCCIKSGCHSDAINLLKQVICLARSSAADVKYSVLQATLMLADALRLLQSDPVYSVLSESSIAFPTHRRKVEVDLRYEDGAQSETTSNCPYRVGNPRKKTTKKQASTQTALLKPKELLSNARELLLSFLYSSLSSSASMVANELSCLLTRVQLISTTLSDTTSLSTYQISCHLNAPKSMRWLREVASIGADNVLGDKSSVFAWPEIHDYDERTTPALDCAVLQQQLNKILPPSWNIITMAMDDGSSDMLISKIRQDHSPFLLRLPLDRSAGEDLDEEPFRFHTACSELGDIISNANLTAHDMKAGSSRQGKKLWWAAREALDARLESLLENIESLWLGGFRGIFSDQCHDEELLSRFLESLSRTLDRHLPSRRKAGATTKSSMYLHSYVLELFVALGHPDEGDLDDAITDLLYFLIDILQFQGERNAYDEVDFDAAILEVSDALRSYHEAVKDAAAKQGRHTVLILDKSLHSFPWESLPCLQGQSVSRMSSLACLQERLLRMREDDEFSSGFHIDARNGAYILNPSSDLASTEKTFLGSFSHSLATYTSIVGRAPSEAEFESCLRDKDLCLYFGHGSGAQYIRGRTIKRLKQCAVAFLMGCSSSKMVECGQFEPYGVPYNYLYGGSAAVVGTLWDVTDKDIDRFAMETFINWGLLDRKVVVETTKDGTRKPRTKGKGRGMGSAKRENAGPPDRPAEEKTQTEVGLGDAIAKARDACVLRYLNGAAPVIYGIPVYLNR